MNICCPKCGKILGEQVQDHIEIDNSKTNIQIYGAAIVRRECSNPQCKFKFDMANITH